jgi:hypothetical protein
MTFYQRQRKYEESEKEMVKSIRCTNVQGRISENDGQVLLYSGSSVGTFIRIRDSWVVLLYGSETRVLSEEMR